MIDIVGCCYYALQSNIDGLVEERCNSIANALELCHSALTNQHYITYSTAATEANLNLELILTKYTQFLELWDVL